VRLRRARSSDEPGESTVADEHNDDIVELTRLAFIAEAIAIKQTLARVGINAAVFESDGGGWAPHYGIAIGNRVMVRAQDLEQARRLLSDDGGLAGVEPQSVEPQSVEPQSVEPPLPPGPVRKHLRHNG
jgi:hypothetical protein